MTQQLKIVLPWPPTVNTYYRLVVMGKAPRVLISKRGREYREACSAHVHAQRIPRNQLTGKLSVTIAAFPPDRRTRDLDNLLKGLLDAMRHASVIRDDADIDRLAIERGPVRKDGEVHLEISEIAGEATVSADLFQGVAA